MCMANLWPLQEIGGLGYDFEPQPVLPDDYEVLSDSAVERERWLSIHVTSIYACMYMYMWVCKYMWAQSLMWSNSECLIARWH